MPFNAGPNVLLRSKNDRLHYSVMKIGSRWRVSVYGEQAANTFLDSCVIMRQRQKSNSDSSWRFTVLNINTNDPLTVLVIETIHRSDIVVLRRLLADNPGLAASRLGGVAEGRTPLHVVADWPGYFPNGPEVVRVLIEAGADPNARHPNQPFSETPLHWAASSDDVEVASALIDGGADVEIPNGSIGTPLDNAIGYGCWHVARLLVQRGAKVEKLWHAAAPGMLDSLEYLLENQSGTDTEAVSQAFWHACGAGQRRTAEFCSIEGPT